MPSFVPPNGFFGFAQQTPAAQALYRRTTKSSGGRRRKKKRAASVKRARRIPGKSARRSTRGASKFTKGSAAAKRHMAKLRKMRKK